MTSAGLPTPGKEFEMARPATGAVRQHCSTRLDGEHGALIGRGPAPVRSVVSTQPAPTASEQITQICTVVDRSELGCTAVQIGGSARANQEHYRSRRVMLSLAGH